LEVPPLRNLLIVDDQSDLCEMLDQILRKEGYHSDLASNGAEALGLLDSLERVPCVILTDWQMPVMNGEALLLALGADVRWASIPCVVMTAQRGVRSLRAKSVLLKPMGLDELLRALEGACTTSHPPTGKPLDRRTGALPTNGVLAFVALLMLS